MSKSSYIGTLNVKEKIREFQLLKRRLPRMVGNEAVNFFTNTFTIGGFPDRRFQKWPEPRRRQVHATVGGKVIYKYDDHNSWWKGKGSVTAYTRADRKRAILVQSGDLRRSIRIIEARPGKVIVGSDLVYAAVHNFGLRAGRVKMPARKFIGNSTHLSKKIDFLIRVEVARILNKK